MPRTKILCTIGPACDNKQILLKMARNGLSGIRINTAHVDPSYVSKTTKLVNSVNSDLKMQISVQLDLKGPELRVGKTDTPISVKKGKTYSLSESGIPVNRDNFFSSLRRGNKIVMQDGMFHFSVVSATGKAVTVKALDTGSIRQNARINVPGVKIELGTLTERDLKFIEAGSKNDVDFYALSFVQSREDMWRLQDALSSAGSNGRTVSKIETRSGYSEIREIANSSDMVMVARGDLGVELPVSEVAVAQKRIISEAHKQGIPAIVATQMLESMVQNDSPTRAEVSDVTNAIFDNCDVVMTSEETAIGKHPSEVVSYLKNISEYAEKAAGNLIEPDEFFGNQIAFSVCRAAKVMSQKLSAKHILVFTKSGSTAQMMSALRPDAEIIAVVTSGSLARKISMLRGVVASVIPKEFESGKTLMEAIDNLPNKSLFMKGEDVIVASGAPYFLFGGTNDVRVVTIGEFLGRGYPSGRSLNGIAKFQPDDKGEILFVDALPAHTGQGTKVLITSIDLTDSMKSAIRDKGISLLTNTQFARRPRPGERIGVNCQTGVITSLESAD